MAGNKQLNQAVCSRIPVMGLRLKNKLAIPDEVWHDTAEQGKTPMLKEPGNQMRSRKKSDEGK